MRLWMGAAAAAMAAGAATAQEAGIDPSTMTCIEFVALDAAGQTSVVAAIRAAEAAEAAADTAEEAAVEGDAPAAEATPDPRDPEGEAAEEDAGDAPAVDPGLEDLVTACSTIPDMRVTDAMMQATADAEAEAEGG